MKNLMTILMVVLVVCLCGSAGAAVLNVPSPGHPTIQSAIDAAVYGDTINVAAGTYEEHITLKNGVSVIGDGELVTTINGGGFGLVVTAFSCDANTVLEGFTIANRNVLPYTGHGMYNDSSSPTVTNCTFSNNTNSYYGGAISNYNSSPTVTDCKFIDNRAGYGGGIYNYFYSSPVVTDCTFTNNVAHDHGGGMYNDFFSNPTVINCTFTGNSAKYGGGMYNDYHSDPIVTDCIFSGNSINYTGSGGGMFNFFSSPTVTDCKFIDNTAGSGGGMYNHDDSNPTVTNCTFSSNSAVYHGGGMCNAHGSDPIVTNCTFSGNLAYYHGGGMYNYYYFTNPTIINCTFSGNTAHDHGGGMYNNYYGSPTIINCIMWGNTATNEGDEILNYMYSIPTISFSDIAGCLPDGLWDTSLGSDGGGNIDADPLFVGAPADLHLFPGSPCVDEGDNSAIPSGVTTDLDGNPRIVNLVVDMGAYELQNAEPGVPPVADAGDDRAIIELGTLVQLDGTQSYDDDGDHITYLWEITGKPYESAAVLDDETLAEPSFVADLQGEYVIKLVVSDPWESSDPDEVIVSFDNIKPVADGGGNQAVVTGATVLLDGSGSFDANLDELIYSWTFVSVPEGSGAEFTDPASVQTDFEADVAGEYRISLVVNDGLVDSNPDNITILAVASDSPIIQILVEAINVINSLASDVFKNESNRGSLTRVISDAIEEIDGGFPEDALLTLEGILSKIDGCAMSEPPEYENDDWIRDCDAQEDVYQPIMDAIELLEGLVGP